jgi:hypothetical protein
MKDDDLKGDMIAEDNHRQIWSPQLSRWGKLGDDTQTSLALTEPLKSLTFQRVSG